MKKFLIISYWVVVSAFILVNVWQLVDRHLKRENAYEPTYKALVMPYVFKAMNDDFSELNSATDEARKKELQERLNIESHYLVGTPPPEGDK